MEKKITVGVAEDNVIVLEMLVAVIRSEEQFELVGEARTGMDAIKLVREKQPDVMLLDMVMPQGGGLDVMAVAKEENIQKTKFIAISALGEERVAQEAMAYGAHYFILKPFEADSIIRRVKAVCEEPRTMKVRDEQTEVEHIITKSLLTLGVPAQLNGYQYLREAIAMVVMNPQGVTAITRQLYPVIAERHNASGASVERAIRHAIEVSWNRGSMEAINRMFGYTINNQKGKPTNSEYIAMVADHIRMGYNL
ncbi:MAG: sporulation transcription factor Spo0A [Lachnospiraceae bacterium]|nr:sporulation transcription factor Spo0A [Lachnospiraceae bacterium]